MFIGGILKNFQIVITLLRICHNNILKQELYQNFKIMMILSGIHLSQF
jgi:hypothetical protein